MSIDVEMDNVSMDTHLTQPTIAGSMSGMIEDDPRTFSEL